jgi:hypothetical protein
MYLQLDNGIFDADLHLLQDLFAVLDPRLERIQVGITTSFDPDAMGHFDEAEYLCGMGFIACQRYLAATFGSSGISKEKALALGPVHTGGEPIARILNAAANYWKHIEEWDPHSAILHDQQALQPNQLATIRTIETVAAWDDYTCANLLASLTAPNEPRLHHLLPLLEAWRNQLAALGGTGFQACVSEAN